MNKTIVVTLLGLIGSLSWAAVADDFPPMLTVSNLTHFPAEVKVDGGHSCKMDSALTKDGNEYYYECYYTPDVDLCNKMPSNGADFTCMKLDLSKVDHKVVVTVNGKKLSADAPLIHHQGTPEEPGETPPEYDAAYCSIKQGKNSTLTISCK